MGTLLLAGAVNQMPSQVRPKQVLKLLLPGKSGKGLFWWAAVLASPLIAWIPLVNRLPPNPLGPKAYV